MLLLPLLLATSQSWVWARPPTHISSEDRHGLSCRQILAMGEQRWSEFADSGDRAEVVYGYCLRESNDARLRMHASRYRGLRSSLFLFAMACIGLEDVLAGGGTYSIHEARYVQMHVEEALRDLLTKPRSFPHSPGLVPRLRAQIDKYERLVVQPHEIPGNVTSSRVHLWARRVDRYFGESLRWADKIGPAARPRVETFLRRYLIDYLAIRGGE